MDKKPKESSQIVEIMTGSFWIVILLAMLLILIACSSTQEPRNEPTRVTQQAGRVNIAKGSNEGMSGIQQQVQKPGEILVKFKDDVTDDRKREIIETLDLETIRMVSRPNLYLVKVRGNSSVQGAIKRLQQFHEVEYAEPNYTLKAQ